MASLPKLSSAKYLCYQVTINATSYMCTSLKATKFYTNSEDKPVLKRLPCINYNLTKRLPTTTTMV